MAACESITPKPPKAVWALLLGISWLDLIELSEVRSELCEVRSAGYVVEPKNRSAEYEVRCA